MAQHQRRPGEPHTRGDGSKFKWILIGVAVLGVLGIGYSVWSAQAGGAATGPVTIENAEPQAIAQQAQPMRKGNPNATVQIVEFADYQCPGCAHFATNVALPIRSAYVDNDRVQMVYYDYPIVSAHPHAFLAARAARCAGEQDEYWDMHDMLYARQQEWSLDRTAPVDRYVGYAESVGVETDAFESCLRSDKYADVVTANALLGEQLGVRSTPTIFINGRNVGAAWSEFEAMKRLIDAALATSPAPAAGAPDPAGSGSSNPADSAAAEAR